MGNRTESQASTALLRATQGLVMNTSGSITTRAKTSMQIYPEVANAVVLGHAPLSVNAVNNIGMKIPKATTGLCTPTKKALKFKLCDIWIDDSDIMIGVMDPIPGYQPSARKRSKH